MISWSHASSEHQKGFTLLEVLVSFVILALALGTVLRVLATGVATTETADRVIAAVSVARSRLAELGTVEPVAAGRRTGTSPGGFRWLVAVSRSQPPDATNSRPTTAYDVMVTVSWGEEWRGRSVTLSSTRLGAEP